MSDVTLPAFPSTDLVPAADAETLAQDALRYAVQSHGAGTLKAYRSAYRAYNAWCETMQRDPLCADPSLIAIYIAHLAKRLSVSSIRVHLAAIVMAHRSAGKQLDLKHPTIAPVLEGVTRVKGSSPGRQAEPAVIEAIQAMVRAQPATVIGLRNRALLLVGFGAALRRSELVFLKASDVRFHSKGVILTLQRSKTDQHGAGTMLAIHAASDPLFCAAKALKDWFGVYSPTGNDAPLFCSLTKSHRPTGQRLHDRMIARLIKESAKAAGLPNPDRFSGHSLRSGLLTTAGENQEQLADIMRQSRHQSTEVALNYIRPSDLWKNNITKGVFER